MSAIPEFAIYCGDCRDILPTLPSLADACICDPPYGLKFMGKGWDHEVPGPDFWKAVLDACKPGAHLLAFGGTRTFHRLGCAIEDAGWEMRDTLMWVYGSGFPKSLDVSKAIDKRGGNSHLTAEIGAAIKSARLSRGVSIKDADSRYCQGSTLWTWYEGRPAGQQLPTAEVMAAIARDWPELQRHAELIAEAEREVVGIQTGTVLAVAPGQGSARSATTMDITAPATDAARQWSGWGTALKPAHEPIVVGYRPLTAEQFVALLTEKIRFQLCQLLSVSDAEKALNASPAKSSEVAHSVPELARTYELANSGNVRFVAKRFTCTKAALNAATVDSVQENAKASGNQTFARETAIPLGMVDDFLIQLMATSTSGTMADISVNTVSSWLEISDALLNAASTFTIETGIRLTIALRTLSLFLSQTISSDTGSLSLDASPNCQPIFLARKPIEGTVAQNVQKHGCGALNIDACRIPTNPAQDDPRLGGEGDWRTDKTAKNVYEGGYVGTRIASSPLGRWPANLAHDGSPEVLACFPDQAGAAAPVQGTEPSPQHKSCYSPRDRAPGSFFNDSGSAARFFYCAKASKQDRDEGCESIPITQSGMSNGAQLNGPGYDKGQDIGLNRVIERRNHHPTVKPTNLMRYLVKLVSQPGATILDPFMGSGSTGKAAILEGRIFTGIELQPDYIPIATARLSHAVNTWKESSKQQQLPIS